jgi:3-oxoacyl-[acyl-carrier protein] reductase
MIFVCADSQQTSNLFAFIQGFQRRNSPVHLFRSFLRIFMSSTSSSSKTILITGASRGIGAQTARTLAAQGHRVLINYHQSADKANALVAEIKAAGGKADAIAANMAEPEQINALFATAQALAGHIDVLINNAGIIEMTGMEAVTPEHIDRQLAINVRAPALAAQAFVNQFKGTDGRIINLSTFVTRTQAMGGALIYCASKGAINTLTTGWAQELGGKGIRVNAVAPGAIETDMYAATGKNFEDFLKSRTPLGTIGQPSDIANMIAYLCSEQSAWITGQIFNVNGGIRI